MSFPPLEGCGAASIKALEALCSVMISGVSSYCNSCPSDSFSDSRRTNRACKSLRTTFYNVSKTN
jgi:hypothetical protein